MFGIICEEVGNIGRFLPVGEFGIDNAAEKFTELLHPLVEIEFAVDEVNLRHFRISISESARPILMAKRACLLSASRSEEHTSELQSLMRISYAVFCLKKNR